MEILDDTPSIRAAVLNYPDPVIRALLSQRIQELDAYPGYSVGDLARFIVAEPGDTSADIEAALGFPIMTDMDGCRWPDEDFQCWAEHITDHDGYVLELVLITDDSGFGHVVLARDIAGVPGDLLAMLRRFATPAS